MCRVERRIFNVVEATKKMYVYHKKYVLNIIDMWLFGGNTTVSCLVGVLIRKRPRDLKSCLQIDVQVNVFYGRRADINRLLK